MVVNIGISRHAYVGIALLVLCILWYLRLGTQLFDIPAKLRLSANNEACDSVQLNMTKVATLMETRALPHLIPLLVNFLSVAPPDWPFVIWTGVANHQLLLDAPVLQKDLKSGRLNLTMLNLNEYTESQHDTGTLSDFLAGKTYFWNSFHPEAEWMLFFQADSVLCSKSDQTLDDWIGYDWVGGLAEWVYLIGHGKAHGGNGGLSMRKISTMRHLTSTHPRPKDGEPEDVHFAQLFESGAVPNARWPDDEGINPGRFSSSQGWMNHSRPEDRQPMGIHSQWIVTELLEWCPEQQFIYAHTA